MPAGYLSSPTPRPTRRLAPVRLVRYAAGLAGAEARYRWRWSRSAARYAYRRAALVEPATGYRVGLLGAVAVTVVLALSILNTTPGIGGETLTVADAVTVTPTPLRDFETQVRPPTTTAAPSCQAHSDLTPGEQSPSVLCLQEAMVEAGLEIAVTGIYDQSTINAVRTLQSAVGVLSVTGVADAETLKHLGIWSGETEPTTPPCQAAAVLETGVYAMDVLCLQNLLRTLGLLVGGQDGFFDTATATAVAAFQQANPPLIVDGIAGAETLSALGIWNGQTNPALRPQPHQDDGTPYPNWRVTDDGIPYYAGRGICSREDADTIAAQFARDGADRSTQLWAMYTASRESGCTFHRVFYSDETKDDSQCAFQLNVMSGHFKPNGVLGRRGWTPELVKSSMAACADAASDLWVRCGRGPWTKPYYCRQPIPGAEPQPSPIVAAAQAPAPAETPPPETTAPAG